MRRMQTEPQRRAAGFTDVNLAFMILAMVGVLAGVSLFYLRVMHAPVVQVKIFLATFTAVLAAGLLGCMVFLGFVRRHNRNVRREMGIPWATNGHGTKAMHSELSFQQSMLQISAKLTQLEDKAHQLETRLMQRAAQGDWNI